MQARVNAATYTVSALPPPGHRLHPSSRLPLGHGGIGPFESQEDRNRAAWPYTETHIDQGTYLTA
ncbi:hypothetical protein BU198_05650 [Streptomyces sp. CBMA156]|nr:hypothetical protein [Streptomyces sp. CBMA156]